MGFLFGWSQLAVILSSSTGAMAFIFGEYCAELFSIEQSQLLGWKEGSNLRYQRAAVDVKFLVQVPRVDPLIDYSPD